MMQALMMEEALFKSAHDALMFAFRFARQQGSKSALADWIKDPEKRKGTGKGLVGLDGAAQAGMVLSELDRMEAPIKAALVCRFSERTCECPSCGGYTFTQEWREARDELTQYVLSALSGAASPRQMRRSLVEKHFGVSVEMGALASRHKVDRSTVTNHNNAIKAKLERLEEQAMIECEDRLQKAGMVQTA